MSFTLKVDSGSCGSGLDGTENVMSCSDTFSSFYQGTNTRIQVWITCWNSKLPFSLHRKAILAAACVQYPSNAQDTDTYISFLWLDRTSHLTVFSAVLVWMLLGFFCFLGFYINWLLILRTVKFTLSSTQLSSVLK